MYLLSVYAVINQKHKQGIKYLMSLCWEQHCNLVTASVSELG